MNNDKPKVDPQPNHGNDQKGHQENGKGQENGGQGRPRVPGTSHPMVGTWIKW